MKVSYCCLPNVASIIANHNRKKLEARPTDDTRNCRVRSDCPLSNKCQARGIVCKATVTSGNDKKTYIGISEPPFKVRYANHKTFFKHERYFSSAHHHVQKVVGKLSISRVRICNFTRVGCKTKKLWLSIIPAQMLSEQPCLGPPQKGVDCNFSLPELDKPYIVGKLSVSEA